MAVLAGALALLAACGSESPPSPEPSEQAQQKPAEPVVPAEVQAAAESVLGSEAEALIWGDLARTGHEQVLAVNRLKTTPKGAVPGVLVRRVALVSKEGGRWKELLRCDEHLKNPKGYLAGTPLSPVNGWRLQYEQSPEKGLAMYFTPLAQPAGGYIQTIGVRWNLKAKRYQSLDRNFENFLGEAISLESAQSQLRR